MTDMDTASSRRDLGRRPLDARPHGPPVVLVVEDDEAVRDPLRLALVGLMADEADQLLADWRELCRWDTLLPSSSQPAEATRVLSAVGAALERPQPLGFGPDPDGEEATEAFAAEAASIDVAVE